MPIRAFIFDMDDVLCAYDVPRRIARLAALTGTSESHVKRAIWESDYFIRADRGECTAAECLAEFGRRLGVNLSRADWVLARRAAMTPFDEMLTFVSRLREHVQVALLTNNDRLLAEMLDDIFPALRPLFGQHCYISAELDLAKPDPEIFRHLVARLGIAPNEALFIDDLDENVDGAKAAGLHALRFDGYAALQTALSAYDLPAGIFRE